MLWLVVLNCVTCALVRFLRGGRLVVKPTQVADRTWRPKLFLISGLKSQPSESYAKINFGDKYHRVLLKFSLLGFNPRVAGMQLRKLVAKERSAVVCAVSLGAKVVEYSKTKCDFSTILINPCSHPQSLRKDYKYYLLFRYFSLLLELVSYALGWVAVLPILTDDLGSKTSIALLIDQLFWIGHRDVTFALDSNVGVIVSTNDEMMNNATIFELYQGAHFAEINSLHGRIASSRYSEAYECAILNLLNQIAI